MKKNSKLMRASFVLLVLTLITSCFVGGTFAKYVSEGEGTDSARVAKWGVVVTGKGDAFAKEYAADDNSDGISISVKSDTPVVAPGTSGTFKGVTITGTPEVAVKVETVATVDLTGDWIGADGSYYCPLVFDINGVKVSGLDASSTDDFETKLKNSIESAANGVVPAGEDLAASDKVPVLLKGGNKISWEWAFEGNDTNDTALGNAAANGDAPNISLKLETTVTQID